MSPPKPAERPRHVLWEITRACNLRCRHCLAKAGPKASDELSPAEALAVCDELASVGAESVALMGGEPLLRPDWPQLVERLSALGIPTSLTTNGVLFDESTARRARALGVTQAVVSLDGGRAVHERLRGKGTFPAALGAIRAARDAGIPHRLVLTSVHSGNVGELPAILAVLLDAAPGATWGINLTSLRHGARMSRRQQLDVSGFLQVVEFVAEARARHRGLLRVVGAHDLGYFSTRYPDLQGGPWQGCRAGVDILGLTASGDVKGCLALQDEFIEGNLRRAALGVLWRDPGRFAYNRSFSDEALRGRCAGCRHGAECRGGCLELGVTMTGEAHHAPFCLHRLERGEER